MNTLVINRTQDTERFNFQQQQLSNLDLPFDFVVAVEKDSLTDEMRAMYPGAWQRPLRDGEIACNLSHLKCWQTVAAQSKPMLILEDDAVICDHIKGVLKKLQDTKKYNYISLEVRTRAKFISKTNTQLLDAYTLHDLIYDKGGAAGYILWPEGAKMLVQHIETKGLAPADALIAECKDLTHGQVRPAPILQLDVCPLHKLPQLSDPSSVIRNDTVAPTSTSENKNLICQSPTPKADSFGYYLQCKKNRVLAQANIFFTTYVRSIFSSDIEQSNVGINTGDFKIYQEITPSE